ncbi:glycosyltransferase [Enterococcus avium]|uniref:glycosyltransferase n=1 Tax=Enterococcus avium TaxID=33945 RepID=UPI003D0F19DC
MDLLHTFMICAYEESHYLEECIQSCVNQVSVIDGKSCVSLYTSTPNPFIQEMCEKYEIKMFTKPGGGIGKDWNNSLSFVKTKYATIAHQDDIYLPEYGNKIITTLEKYPDSNIVFTDYSEIDQNSNLRRRNINLKIKTCGLHLMSLVSLKGYQRRIYAFGNFICCPAVSYNMSQLENFRFDESLKMTLDWDAWERIMCRKGTIHYIANKLMYHRIHEESETTANTNDHTREKEEFAMYCRYWGEGIAKLIMKFYVLNQKSNH